MSIHWSGQTLVLLSSDSQQYEGVSDHDSQKQEFQ